MRSFFQMYEEKKKQYKIYIPTFKSENRRNGNFEERKKRGKNKRKQRKVKEKQRI